MTYMALSQSTVDHQPNTEAKISNGRSFTNKWLKCWCTAFMRWKQLHRRSYVCSFQFWMLTLVGPWGLICILHWSLLSPVEAVLDQLKRKHGKRWKHVEQRDMICQTDYDGGQGQPRIENKCKCKFSLHIHSGGKKKKISRQLCEETQGASLLGLAKKVCAKHMFILALAAKKNKINKKSKKLATTFGCRLIYFERVYFQYVKVFFFFFQLYLFNIWSIIFDNVSNYYLVINVLLIGDDLRSASYLWLTFNNKAKNITKYPCKNWIWEEKGDLTT